eukprot:6172692-Pleurochrysis_carterae.AAC.2
MRLSRCACEYSWAWNPLVCLNVCIHLDWSRRHEAMPIWQPGARALLESALPSARLAELGLKAARTRGASESTRQIRLLSQMLVHSEETTREREDPIAAAQRVQ